jgi:hypothetical protein
MPEPLLVSAPAERNKGPILEVLRSVLPPAGTVLEVASGTGQHVVHFAAALPGLAWQPSEADAARRALIAARVAAAALPNVRAPVALDVLSHPWPLVADVDAVLAINLVHISPWSVTAALIDGARRHLRARGPGVLVLYGPYKEEGRHVAPSNEAFDRTLRAENPEWGIRDLQSVAALAAERGFGAPAVTRMPANNLTVVFRAAPAR